MKAFSPLILLVGACAAVPAVAQVIYDNRASTVGESRARGLSDVVRSRGAANLANSAAAQNWESARSQYLDNRLQATDTYFEMRQKNRAYRAAERGPRPTPEQLFRLSKVGVPDKLSPSEMDPLTGKIQWPIVLEDDIFADSRKKLDELFAARAKSRVNIRQVNEMVAVVKEMQNELKKHVKDYPSNLYMGARNFLSSLSYKASRPTG